MKLHIGCGNRYIPGWVNLDINRDLKVDIVDDAGALGKIANLSCDIIYVSHVLEHFGRHEFLEILKVWHSKLKVGGILRLSVPDFDGIVSVYNKTGDLPQLLGLLCGGQRNCYDYHKIVFNKELLTSSLLSVGFANICEWDWKETCHSEIDDYSQAYLPHLDKEAGTLVSLNLEAIRGI